MCRVSGVAFSLGSKTETTAVSAPRLGMPCRELLCTGHWRDSTVSQVNRSSTFDLRRSTPDICLSGQGTGNQRDQVGRFGWGQQKEPQGGRGGAGFRAEASVLAAEGVAGVKGGAFHTMYMDQMVLGSPDNGQLIPPPPKLETIS